MKKKEAKKLTREQALKEALRIQNQLETGTEAKGKSR